jgi:two-component system LytT family response regulator
MDITVAIVDDEHVARARLRRLLSAERDVTIVAECADGPSAIDAIADKQPDVVFLDVQMPGCDGFQVVRAIPEHELPLIVFVTAYDEHAVRAFEVSALDYVLKPFDGERLQLTLARIRKRADPGAERRKLLAAVEQLTAAQQRIEHASSAMPGTAVPPSAHRDRILVRAEGKSRLVNARDIDYIESAANYVRLHVGGEAFMLREPIGTITAQLDPGRFARIHRRVIVNLARVREIEPWFSGDAIVTLHDGKKLRVSRSQRGAFQHALDRHS